MHMISSSPRNQRGVGLIEVLIAVLVLSFGMLGMVGLQTWSLRANQSALERGMATIQTHTIADVMRADRMGATNGDYNVELGEDASSTNAMAEQAIEDWRASLRQSLNESADGAVDCGFDADNFRCLITVQWNDSRGEVVTTEDPPESLSIQTEVRL